MGYSINSNAPNIVNFNNRNTYAWNVITVGGTINNFDPSVVTVNAANFGAPMAGGSFSMTVNGKNLQLIFTPSSVDIDAPTVAFTPINGTNTISGSSLLKITLFETVTSIDGTTFTNANIANAINFRTNNINGANVAFNASINGLNIIIQPTTSLVNGQTYYLGIVPNSVKDLAGNVLTQTGITFNTANTAPTIIPTTITSPLLSLTPQSPGYSTSTIGDAYDPATLFGFNFLINDLESPNLLSVSGISLNTTVIPNTGIIITSVSGGVINVKLNPTNFGYADVNINITDGFLTNSYTIKMAVSSSLDNPTANVPFLWYTGTQETSSGLAIDDNYMIVEDDENNALRIYNRKQSGLPLTVFDVSPFLTGSTGKNDTEGCFSVPGTNKIYWTSSYSNSSSGNNDNNRRFLFMTTISGAGSTTGIGFGGFYNNLRQEMIAWDNSNGSVLGFNKGAAAGISSDDLNGFNIEGMELAPNNTDVYMCFRAPQITVSGPNLRNKALIVKITNFETCFANKSFPSSSFSYFTIDLGGRVIREIRKNANNEYLISAGPTAGVNPPLDVFRLYSWNGDPNSNPVERDCELNSLNNNGNGMGAYETIIQVPTPLTSTSQIQLMIDCGDADFFTRNGVSYKGINANWMKFRGDLVTLGKNAQRVNIAPIPQVSYGTSLVQINSTATSGLAVSYSVSTNPANIATLVNTNQVSITGVGNITVTGTQVGDATFAPTLATQTFNVIPALATVTSFNATKVYGTVNPTFLGTVVGLVNVDVLNPTYILNGNNIIPSVSGTVLANYSLTTVAGTLSITPAGLTVTAFNATATYGQILPVFTGTVVGLVNGDNVNTTFSSIATSISGANTYSIVPFVTGAALVNYTLTTVAGTLTINKAIQTINGFPSAIPTLTIGGVNYTFAGVSVNSGLPIVYVSNNANIVSVQNNVLSAVGFGATNIVASVSGNNNYLAVSSTLGVNVVTVASPLSNVNVATVSGLQTNNVLSVTSVNIKVSISGSNFLAGATATVGGVALTNVSVTSTNLLIGTIAAGSTVINPSNPSVSVQNSGSVASTSTNVTPSVTAVTNANEIANIVSIYPNPSQGSFTLTLNAAANVSIFGTDGQKVYSQVLESGDNNLKLALQKGIYFVKSGYQIQKLVIE